MGLIPYKYDLRIARLQPGVLTTVCSERRIPSLDSGPSKYQTICFTRLTLGVRYGHTSGRAKNLGRRFKATIKDMEPTRATVCIRLKPPFRRRLEDWLYRYASLKQIM